MDGSKALKLLTTSFRSGTILIKKCTMVCALLRSQTGVLAHSAPIQSKSRRCQSWSQSLQRLKYKDQPPYNNPNPCFHILPRYPVIYVGASLPIRSSHHKTGYVIENLLTPHRIPLGSWTYGKGRQGRQLTSLGVGLEVASVLFWSERWEKYISIC